jgi:putative heme iron utilization protein
LRARYLRYFPAAERLLGLGDFSFFHIEPVTLRYIGGFGAIHWVSASSYAPPANTLAQSEADVVAHMNSEHAAALREYCRHFKQASPVSVVMAGLDCDGFDLHADGSMMRFDFPGTVVDADTARIALREMLAEARR